MITSSSQNICVDPVSQNGHKVLIGSWNTGSVSPAASSSHKQVWFAPASGGSCKFRTSTFINEVKCLLSERRARRVCFLIAFNVLSCFFVLSCCASTQSMALRAYMYTMWFNLLSLLTCLLSTWIVKQKPTTSFTLGYERFEVVAVFASTILAQLGAFFIIKESIERLIDQPDIHTGRLLLGTLVAFFSHLVVIYGSCNTALDHVIAASSSSWLQEHMSDISQSLCSVIPPLSRLLLPRVNPMLLIACAGALALFITNLLIDMKNYYVIDTLTAISIALMICATMLPMCIYSGKVLLQTTPAHVVGQLDKCLRETLTIDGVLEFKNEHFWTLSFGRLAGSLHVRVRRDANEQLVLAHIVDRLSNLVSVLSVQVFKDNWSRSTSLQIPNDTSFLFNMSPHSSHGTAGSTQVNYASGMSPNVSYPYSPNSMQAESASPSLYNGGLYGGVKQGYKSAPLINQVGTPGSPGRRNPFLPNFSLPSPAQSNNLLISGVRTLDAEKFAYQPR